VINDRIKKTTKGKLKMATTKQLLEKIENCDNCFGLGYFGWVSQDGDYDFEYCECNPHEIIIGEDL
jgi:hypothetical protein